jgi:hypothetical protein
MAVHPLPEPGPRVERVLVTPEYALELLAHNRRNRRVSRKRVAQFARDIKAGRWKLTGDTIKLRRNGEVEDGQHRLLAIVLAGQAVETFVAYGVADVIDVVDTGRARTFADLMRIRGERHSDHLAAAVRIVWAYRESGLPLADGRLRRSTHAELLETLEGNPDLRASLGRYRVLGLSGSRVAVLHYLFSKASVSDADAFFGDLTTGVTPEDGHPIYVLRERLSRDAASLARVPERVRIAFVIIAWNHWRNGQPLYVLRFRAGGADPQQFPPIDGVEPGMF